MKKLKRYFRLADLFARDVSLKYKGERYRLPFSHYRRFYTNFGALTSVVIITVMLTLLGIYVHTMLQMKHNTFSESSQIAEPTNFTLG